MFPHPCATSTRLSRARDGGGQRVGPVEVQRCGNTRGHPWGLPKFISGQSVGEKDRRVGTSNPSIVVQLLRNPPFTNNDGPHLENLALRGPLLSSRPLLSSLVPCFRLYFYKKDVGNRVCSPRGFRIPKGSSRK